MRDLIKKFSTFSIGPIAGAFLGFLIVPIITHFISSEEYGKSSMFTLAQGAVSMLIYLGMDQAFVREFHQEKENISRLMSNAIIIPTIFVIILDTFILIKLEFISNILFGSPHEYISVYLMALMFPFMIIENFSMLKIRMEERGGLYSFFTILLKSFVLLTTIVMFLLYEKSFRSVVYSMAIAEIINGIILYFVVINRLKLSIKYFDRNLLSRMLKFGVPLIPASLLGWVLTSMDKIMLRSMCTYSELGLYTAAFKIVSILSIVQTCFTLFWTPVAYRWYEENVSKTRFEMINRLVSFIMTEMCLSLLLFKDLVGWILGKDFINAIYIFPFILLYPIMYTISEATCVGIVFKRKTYYNILISGVAGIVNIILNYILIPILYGKGAAIATGISYMIFFWMRTIISRKLWWKFQLKRYLIYCTVILFNCCIHTFLSGGYIYIISALSILGIAALHLEDIKVFISKLALLKSNGING